MSKKSIRPEGSEGTSHPHTIAKSPLTVNDLSTPLSLRQANGFLAAEQWHIAFCTATEDAEGYFFPSGLRQTFDALPDLARPDFLDAIGALLVTFQVSGEPAPGRQNLREDVALCAMTHEEQDSWAQTQDDAGDKK